MMTLIRLPTKNNPMTTPEFSIQKNDEIFESSPEGGLVRSIYEDIKNRRMSFLQNVITADRLMKDGLKVLPYLVETLFQQKGLACVAGASDTGKSRLLRQLAIAVVHGRHDFLGFPVNTKYKSCIYVSTEDDDDSTAVILQKQGAELNEDARKRLRFIFDTDNLLETIDASLSEQPADLVIIDSFSDIFGNDLKDSSKIRACLHEYRQLSLKHGCLFLFLHHTCKRAEDSAPSKNNLLSGQGLEAKMRMVVEFRLDANHPDRRHLCIVKANYLPPEFKTESFVLEFDEITHSFINTEERVPFEQLVKGVISEADVKKYQLVKKLQQEGKSLDDIAPLVNYAGKSGLSKFINKMKNVATAA